MVDVKQLFITSTKDLQSHIKSKNCKRQHYSSKLQHCGNEV